jgi:hypothetical protein
MRKINIQIVNHEECGYSVVVNGEVLLECLAEDEVEAITIKELVEMDKQHEEDEK